MTHIEKIKKLINEHNGIVTSAMLTKNNIPRLYLKKLTESGELLCVCRGIYVSPDAWEDEMFILQAKFPKGIFSHETALYIHGLTDRTPMKYAMTFPYGYHTSSIKAENISEKHAIDELYNLGITKAKSPCNNDIRLYNAEKTLCDIVKAGCDIQIVNDAMKRYAKSKSRNIKLLYEYADILRVKNKISNYMEVLL
ncbi:MAG: type IV toxin-antitoxin system AbiEi family antitoxin domain-containing protein [Clostridia bacterium]|nr:type IV toxin-antitoxin system AbiEi family antitoxin domain-containing protein [Clostridia bacterium]